MLTAKQKVDLINLYAKVSDRKFITNQEEFELIIGVEKILKEGKNIPLDKSNIEEK